MPKISHKNAYKTRGRIFTLLVLGIVLLGLIYSVSSPFANSSIGSWSLPKIGFPSFPKIDLPNFGTKLKGFERSSTNILILGSDYGISTDTIIILNIDYSSKQLSTLTLPRDLQVTIDSQTQKINSLLQSNITSGLTTKDSLNQTTQFISKLIGKPIDYYAKINIGGFLKVIDSLGGIEIDVENSFGDCNFPTPNFDGYIRPCPEFTKGKTIMNSTTALIFARSRKSYNNPLEAIDFARSRRQSKVIEAVLTKIKTNPLIVPSLLSNLSDNLVTDIDLTVIPSLINQYSEFSPTINNTSLDYESGIVCPDPNSSDIIFCDPVQSLKLLHRLTFTGDSKDTKSKLPIEFQNLKIAIISNGSNEALTLVSTLKSQGFTSQNIFIDTSFQSIKLATANSLETTKIYTKNQELLKFFNSQKSENPTWKVFEETQSKYNLSQEYRDSDVVIVVE